MELYMGYDRRQVDGAAFRRPARGSVSRRDAVEAPGLEPRDERFEAITIRAAARVLQLQRAGVVSAREARFYLRELTDMDAHAGRHASPALARAAERHL